MSGMLERTSFDTPTLPRLAQVIAELQSGVFVIPEFQRPSIWRDEQRLALLDSIVKGLPIGSLLVWRSKSHKLQTYPTISGIEVPRAREGAETNTYLIDGHQRISTLFGALVKPPRGRVGPDVRRWPLYYELGTSENPAFKLPPRGAPPIHWLPLDILLDGKALFRFREALFQNGEDELADEAERVANVFKDYILPVVPLVTENLDLVTDAFVRINSLGSDMSEAHMLRALTFLKKDIDTDKGFRAIKDALRPLGWGDVPDQVLVNSLKAMFGLDVYRSSVTELNGELKRRPEALSRLQDALSEAVGLLKNFGVMGWSALPYAYQLVTLAALASFDPGSLSDRAETLRLWFWRTTYAEHFTGQTGGQIRREIDELVSIPAGMDPGIAHRAEVVKLMGLRRGRVRTKAFLLFLASQPTLPGARVRRQELLATKDTRAFAPLFPRYGADPGNVVLADTSELRELRAARWNQGIDPDIADEFCIPPETLEGSFDEEIVIEKRREILLQREEDFIVSLGLKLRPDNDDEPDDHYYSDENEG